MAAEEKIILVANPGSASRKYALYKGSNPLAKLHFEYDKQRIIAHLEIPPKIRDIAVKLKRLDEATGMVGSILEHFKLLPPGTSFDAAVIRIVAPGNYFTADHIVDDDFMAKLDKVEADAPLHVGLIKKELLALRKVLPKTPIVAVSDSAFHANRARITDYYAIDPLIADKFGIKRYGYHGFSVAYVADYFKRHNLIGDKVIVAHLGSGASVTALYKGESLDNSMGFSPLEGLVMATRSGDIDVSAASSLKRHLKLDSDGLVEYLNNKSGLLGVSGQSGDLRDLITLRNAGDDRASLAIALYVHYLQSMIGRMAAELNGVDALIFTGTVGQRSFEIRRLVAKKLTYLGFMLDQEKNTIEVEADHKIVSANNSKPIYVINTNETLQMVQAAQKVLESQL